MMLFFSALFCDIIVSRYFTRNETATFQYGSFDFLHFIIPQGNTFVTFSPFQRVYASIYNTTDQDYHAQQIAEMPYTSPFDTYYFGKFGGFVRLYAASVDVTVRVVVIDSSDYGPNWFYLSTSNDYPLSIAPDPNPDEEYGTGPSFGVIVFLIILTILIFVVGSVFYYCCCVKRKNQRITQIPSSRKVEDDQRELESFEPRVFSARFITSSAIYSLSSSSTLPPSSSIL